MKLFETVKNILNGKIEKSNPYARQKGGLFGFKYGPDTGLNINSNNSSEEIKHENGFVLTKNGEKDFGEISKEFGKQIKRQAGKIRLRIGWQDDSTDKGSGEVHIERPKRMIQLKQVGFSNARDFIENICNGYDQIYSSGRKLLLVKSNDLYTCVIEMLPDNEGGFYDVNTAYISDKNNMKNKILKKKIGLVWSKPTSLDLSKSLMPFNSKSISSIPRGLIKGTSDTFSLSRNIKMSTEKLNKSLTYSGHKLQGRTKLYGMNISIENKKGSYRSGTDKDGHKWKTFMNYDYGYIRETVGVDDDHVDCYIGPDKESEKVYVIHQNDPVTHKYNEDKCMLCFESADTAKKAYMKQYDRPGFFGSMEILTVEQFKTYVFSHLGSKIHKSFDVVIKDITDKNRQKKIDQVEKSLNAVYEKQPFIINHIPAEKFIINHIPAEKGSRLYGDITLRISNFDKNKIDKAGNIKEVDLSVYKTSRTKVMDKSTISLNNTLTNTIYIKTK